MSAVTHLDALAAHATRFSAGASAELSSVLLVISGVAMGAAGIGLIILCARALLVKRPATPQPWIAMALASPTLHTRKFSEIEAEVAGPLSGFTPPPAAEIALATPAQTGTSASGDESPLSDPSPVTLRRPPMTGPAARPQAELSPSSRLGPSSTDPTLEMDLGAFATGATSDNDVSPPEPTPPSQPTDTEVFLGSPIPLVSRKDASATLETFPVPADEAGAPAEGGREPMAVHRSGTVPKADPDFGRTLPSFTDGARRA